MKNRLALLLFLFLLPVVWACASDTDDGGGGAECGNGVVEKGEECDFGDEEVEGCTSKCKVEPGWLCDEKGCEQTEICDNEVDDDDNGLVDCADPACASFPACNTDCDRQADCSGLVNAKDGLVMICADTTCQNASTFSSGGDVLFGGFGLFNEFTSSTNTKSLKSFSVHVFHPSLPATGGVLDCETLMKLSREFSLDPRSFNVMRNISGTFGSDGGNTILIPVVEVPATPSDKKWLALTRMYAGPLQPRVENGVTRNEPSGRMLALSCVEVENPPGQYDESRRFVTTAEPTCRNDDDCAPGWSCLDTLGYCVYSRCDPECPKGYVCRELANGEPACRAACGDGGHICNEPEFPHCDSTPGWPRACLGLDE